MVEEESLQDGYKDQSDRKFNKVLGTQGNMDREEDGEFKHSLRLRISLGNHLRNVPSSDSSLTDTEQLCESIQFHLFPHVPRSAIRHAYLPRSEINSGISGVVGTIIKRFYS